MDSTASDFSLLPPHVNTNIFDQLNFRHCLNAARTCKSWYFASCDPVITKKIQVRIKNKLKGQEELRRPFGKLVLEQTNFNEFAYYPEFFARFGQHIRELEFDSCDISFQQLIDCLTLTPCLSSLAIIVCDEQFHFRRMLSDEQVNAIKINIKRVQKLKIGLSAAPMYGVDGLECIMQMMLNVSELNFRIVNVLCADVYKYLIYYINLFKEGINLNRLSIGILASKVALNFFTDFSKITQIISVQELELDLIYRHSFEEGEFEKKFDIFCEKLSGVRILSMRPQCLSELPYVCKHMTQLIELRLDGMDNYPKLHCISSLRNLQKLSIFSKYYLSYSANELLGVFMNLQQLKELQLSYHISEELLHEICVSCTDLNRLELQRMQTNKLEILFQNLLKLKVLHMSFCVRLLEDFTINCDITNLKLLENLKINSFAPGVTIELIEKLPKLRPEYLIEIRTKLQPSYVDPVLEGALEIISGLFNSHQC